MDDEDAAEMAALLGFSAFGARRRIVWSTASALPLAQLHAGTQLLAAFVANGGDRERVETDVHGVTFLAHDSDGCHPLEALLRSQLETLEASRWQDESVPPLPLLPARSYKLLLELQAEKNR